MEQDGTQQQGAAGSNSLQEISIDKLSISGPNQGQEKGPHPIPTGSPNIGQATKRQRQEEPEREVGPTPSVNLLNIPTINVDGEPQTNNSEANLQQTTSTRILSRNITV